jgi:hypothetical protein
VGVYEIEEVDVVLVLDAFDKTDLLGKGYGIGKRLREAAIAGKLQHAVLRKGRGSEVFSVVIQAGFADSIILSRLYSWPGVY